MICPKCGESAHRSHSRTGTERLVKQIIRYKTYRCSKCGWRGVGIQSKKLNRRRLITTIFFWVAGMIIALVISGYAVYDLHSAMAPPPSDLP